MGSVAFIFHCLVLLLKIVNLAFKMSQLLNQCILMEHIVYTSLFQCIICFSQMHLCFGDSHSLKLFTHDLYSQAVISMILLELTALINFIDLSLCEYPCSK